MSASITEVEKLSRRNCVIMQCRRRLGVASLKLEFRLSTGGVEQIEIAKEAGGTYVVFSLDLCFVSSSFSCEFSLA